VTVKQVAANVFLVLFSASLAEGVLRVASRCSPRVNGLLTYGRTTVLLPDQRLGMRGNPAYAEHDAWGFRNASRPERADVVTLGDSQTWGTSVERDAAWPQRLARALGTPVYNMGLGSYGPGQYLLQVDQALSLKPRLVVLAVYFGNDFYDAFRLARTNPEIASLVPATSLPTIDALERREPLERQANVLFSRDDARASAPEPRAGFADRLKLVALAHAIKRQATAHALPLLSKDFAKAGRALSAEERRFCSIFDDGHWRTILTPPYRAFVLDDGDPRIRAGFEVSRRAIERIAERVGAAGSRLVVVLLPTKENVFWSRVRDPAAHVGLAELVDHEQRLKRELVQDMDARGIAYVDLLEALRAAAEQPYFEDADGHPNALGHGIIATEIARSLAPGSARPPAPAAGHASAARRSGGAG
jgi:lysophospholipase L1-like esterase